MLPSLRQQRKRQAEELRSTAVEVGTCDHPHDMRWHDEEEGQVVCRNCGVVLRTHFVNETIQACSTRSGERESRAQDYYTSAKSIYVRKTHLDDFFNNNRGLKTPELHPIVLTTLKYELDRHGLTGERVNDHWIRFFLRCHNWVNYYEFVPYFRQVILYEQNGRPTSIARGSDPHNSYDCLTDELEETIRQMLRRVEHVYVSCKPPSRKNFFSMQFFVRKCLELLGEHARAKHFELPKTTRIREEQERTWYRCCKALKWPETIHELNSTTSK